MFPKSETEYLLVEIKNILVCLKIYIITIIHMMKFCATNKSFLIEKH